MTAAAITQSLGALNRIKRFLPAIETASGAVLVATGLLLATGVLVVAVALPAVTGWRVDVGSSLANMVLLPALPGFRARYPEMELDLGVSDRPVDASAQPCFSFLAARFARSAKSGSTTKYWAMSITAPMVSCVTASGARSRKRGSIRGA